MVLRCKEAGVHGESRYASSIAHDHHAAASILHHPCDPAALYSIPPDCDSHFCCLEARSSVSEVGHHACFFGCYGSVDRRP